jgi:hypothetical protein
MDWHSTWITGIDWDGKIVSAARAFQKDNNDTLRHCLIIQYIRLRWSSTASLALSETIKISNSGDQIVIAGSGPD